MTRSMQDKTGAPDIAVGTASRGMSHVHVPEAELLKSINGLRTGQASAS